MMLIFGFAFRIAGFFFICLIILVFTIPNLGNILARQLVRIPTVQQLELKREQSWIKYTMTILFGSVFAIRLIGLQGLQYFSKVF